VTAAAQVEQAAFRIIQGDAATVLRTLPAESVHMCCCSPPYWGLRDYLDENGKSCVGQLGLEKNHDCLGWATGSPCGACYICHMVEVFREVKRVLRFDGCCFINEGDSYSASAGQRKTTDIAGLKQQSNTASVNAPSRCANGLKPKDLCGMPWRLALSLQADGWYWRDVIVWDKPAPMPESVLDRCTKSWEPILMLAKSRRYYFDQEAIRETSSDTGRVNGREGRNEDPAARPPGSRARTLARIDYTPYGRNKRNVWKIPPMPVSAAHFATYPLELPETCILAGTSERGVCPQCGAPWKRQVQRDFVPQEDVCDEQRPRGSHGQKSMPARNGWQGVPRGSVDVNTIGWRPTCHCIRDYAAKIGTGEMQMNVANWEALADSACDHFKPAPATVLDPFAGSGTTGLAALKHGRNFLGIELSAEYIAISRERAMERCPLLVGEPT
jgi:DNA modification methylase